MFFKGAVCESLKVGSMIHYFSYSLINDSHPILFFITVPHAENSVQEDNFDLSHLINKKKKIK